MKEVVNECGGSRRVSFVACGRRERAERRSRVSERLQPSQGSLRSAKLARHAKPSCM